MLLHIVRYEREEVGFILILSGGRGPEILAASTPFLRGADRVLLDLSVLAIFPMTSMSMALSILHVGLVLGIELQLYRDVLHDLVQAHAGKDDLHPQRLSAPSLRVVEAHQPLPHGVAKYLHVDGVLQPQHLAGFAEVSPEKLHYSGVGVLRCNDPYGHALLCSLLLLILHPSLPVAGEDVPQQVYRFHSRTLSSPRSSGSGMDYKSSNFWLGASTRSSSSSHWRQAYFVWINPSRI